MVEIIKMFYMSQVRTTNCAFDARGVVVLTEHILLLWTRITLVLIVCNQRQAGLS